MAGISDIVSINIIASIAGVARTNFGIPLIAAYHTATTGPKISKYRSLRALQEDHAAGSLVYKIASVAFSQVPRPREVWVGRRATAWSQIVHLIPKITTKGYVYTFVIDGIEVSYTVGVAETVATVCDGIVAAINATAVTVTATDGTTHVVCTSDVAGVFHYYSRSDLQHDGLYFENVTTDASAIATDLDAFEAEDDGWYGVYVDTQSALVIDAAADWVEAREKMSIFDPSDTEITDSAVTDDIGSTLKAASITRTPVWYHPSIGSFLGMGIMAQRFTVNPGSDTWAHKTIAAVAVYKVSNTKQANLEAKNVNWYQTIAGRNVTFPGICPVGTGIYADFIRGRDWLAARMRERIFGLIASLEKLPYEQNSLNLIGAEINAVLEEAADKKFLTRDEAFVIDIPDVDEQDPSDVEGRNVAGVEWSAKAAGAIHTVISITGTVSLS